MTTTFRTHDGRTLDQAASDLVQREVLCCMSSMVAILASGESMNPPRVRDYPHAELIEQAAHLAAPTLDYESAATEAGWRRDGTVWVHDDFEDAETSAENATFTSEVEPHEIEVFEHWAVSQWLGDALQAKGERVDDDFAGLVVWGRTTTGQAISMDAVIQAITLELHVANEV